MNWQNLFGYSATADWILLTAIHSLWLSLAAFLILHIRKLRAPAVRSTWCTFALVVLLGLPLITWFIPRIDVGVQPGQKSSVGMSVAITDSNSNEGHYLSAGKEPLLNRLLGLKTPLPHKWKALIHTFGLFWLAVTLGCVGRLLYELAFLKGYCNSLEALEDDRISVILQEIKESFGFRRKARFFISPKLTSPISMGIRTPSVILPASLYQSIDEGELRAILLHELAHIYHYDHILGLLQRLLKALYWWNPFVYRLCSALSVAREEVSDNHAISGMQSAARYAGLLVNLVEKTRLISPMPCTAGMANPYVSLETRIKNILYKERDMRVKTNKGTISVIVLTMILLCGLVVAGSKAEVLGLWQESSSGAAKSIAVNINNIDANFNMDLLAGSVLVLEASDGSKYQSSPIRIDGNHGNCEFSQPILPAEYKLILSMFKLEARIVIPPLPKTSLTLEMNLSRGGVSITLPDQENL